MKVKYVLQPQVKNLRTAGYLENIFCSQEESVVIFHVFHICNVSISEGNSKNMGAGNITFLC